jgi:hypothetical protein
MSNRVSVSQSETNRAIRYQILKGAVTAKIRRNSVYGDEIVMTILLCISTHPLSGPEPPQMFQNISIRLFASSHVDVSYVRVLFWLPATYAVKDS